MKQKIIKRITAIASIGLAGILVFLAVRDDMLTAKAEETLFGIEALRKEIQDRQETWKILEIVPDEAASEIGYFIPGNEPVLSERQAGTGEWRSWQEGLKKCHTAGERVAYLEGKKAELEAYYAAKGFPQENLPVFYEPYEESTEPGENYRELNLDTAERKGYFQLTQGALDAERYDLAFKYIGHSTDSDVTDGMTTQYYAVQSAVQITSDQFPLLSDSAVVWRFVMADHAERFEVAGTWGDLKDTVSGGNAGTPDAGNSGTPDAGSAGTTVSDGNSGTTINAAGSGAPGTNGTGSGGTGGGTVTGGTQAAGSVVTDYYLVNFEPWAAGTAPASGYPALYAVSKITQNDSGAYEFVEDENGFAAGFPTESIYYKGGFVNQEWFRRNVLNLEEGQEENFPVEVITLTVAELNAMDTLPAYDMLYLNSGLRAGNGAVPFAAGNDLNAKMRNLLFEQTIASQKPCIVDAALLYLTEKDEQGNYKINSSLQNTNIFRLSAMFLQKSPLHFYNENVGTGMEPTVSDLLAGLVEDDDKNFVTEQVYSFFAPHVLIGPDFVIPEIYENGKDTKGLAQGFLAVLDEIVSENLNREADTTGTYQPLSTDVSQASVLRHIINYQNRRQIEVKKNIRVLDLEPCLSEAYTLTEDRIRDWAFGAEGGGHGAAELNVEIDRMTTAEFIGKIENLNEKYDLIYIGTDRMHMNTDTDGNTVFNDASLNGLIYFHTGDLRYTAMELAGQLNNEYVGGNRSNDVFYFNPVRYGGNDITVEKKNALLSFLDASYPVIVSDELFETDGIGMRRIDEKAIDNSSYLYDFIKEAMGRSNFYAEEEIGPDSGMFRFYLNRPKVYFDTMYVNGTKDESGIFEISKGDDGRFLLEYRFTLVNDGAVSADTRYRCRLSVDANADGKFSVDEELKDISITQNGNAVSPEQLAAGQEYILRRYVPDGYKGLLPWKVEVEQVNNSHIRNGRTGFTRLKEIERESVQILQISRDAQPKENLFNLEKRLAQNGDIYHVLVYGGTYQDVYYKGIYDEYDIDVKFMTISEFEEAYRENSDLLSGYNMLILGFSANYGDISGDQATGPMGAIFQFIQSGKSVLFANDTIAASNYTRDKKGVVSRGNPGATQMPLEYQNAYNLTAYLRGPMGMDRYGVTAFEELRSGNNLGSDLNIWDTLQRSGKDMAYVPGSAKTQSYGLTQGYTYSVINAKDVNGNQGSHEKYTTEQTGVMGGFLNTFLNLKYDKVYYSDTVWDDGEVPSPYSGAVSNLWVTQVNRGQITEFPYHLSEEFQISDTRGQAYQLDFNADDDRDGQSDVVVWYCLGYRKNAAGEKQNTIYSISPNDVSNNYYIYNKGNVTYTGMGYAGNTATVEEAKLFINTMIAAYSSGVKDPVITTLKDGTANAAEALSANRYSDEVNDLFFDENGNRQSEDSGFEKVYFRVNDLNFVKGTRWIGVNCFYEVETDATHSISYGGKPVLVKELPKEIYNASNGGKADPDNLTSGQVYYLLVDKAVMGDYGSRFSVYLEAQSTINSYDREMKTGKSYRKFDFTKVRMFDLE